MQPSPMSAPRREAREPAAPRPARQRPARRRAALLVGAMAVLAPVAALPAQLRPVFEVYGTWSDGTTGRGADGVYERLGGLRPGAGMGLGVGVMTRDFDVVAFGETGGLRTRGIAGAGVMPHEFTRTTFGARVEVPVVFVQQLDRVDVVDGPLAGTLRVASPGEAGARPLETRSLGGRLEAGVEHRGFFDTGWFLLGGVAAIGGARGTVTGFTGDAGGLRLVPTLTLGVRSRGW